MHAPYWQQMGHILSFTIPSKVDPLPGHTRSYTNQLVVSLGRNETTGCISGSAAVACCL